MTGYLIISSFLIGGTGAWLISRFAPALGLVDLPNDRSSHFVPTPRAGGVGILLAVVFSAVLLKVPPLLWLPAVFLGLVSLWDDRKGLSPTARLWFQAFAAATTLPAVALPDAGVEWYLVTGLFWVIFLMVTANFFNFMDGINGIAGISGAVGFGLMAVFAYLTGAETWLVTFSACLAAACLGFLPLNFPGARVFLGDVGSILLGFLFAALTARLAWNFSDFLILVGFLLPFYGDTLLTLLVRWRKGDNLFEAHRQHFYQILVHRKGFRHWQVSALYGAAQLLVGTVLIRQLLAGDRWFAVAFIIAALTAFTSVSLLARRAPAS